MRHSFIASLVAASAVALVSQAASAAVRYDFTAESTGAVFEQPDTFKGSFSVTLPGYVTSDAFLQTSDMSSCSATAASGVQASCWLFQDLTTQPFRGSTLDQIQFNVASHESAAGFAFAFNAGDFTTPGYHHSYAMYAGDPNVGTLGVTDLSAPTAEIPAVAAVPEPATWTSLLAGCGVIGWALRRRQAAHDLSA